MENTQTEIIPKLVIKKVIRAKRERVFQAWTDPALMRQWLVPPDDWTAETKVDVRPGGKYEHVMIVGESLECHGNGKYTPGERLPHYGEYIEVKPPEKLVFSWSSPSVQNSRVTIELRDLGDSTELWLTHELLPTEQSRNGHNEGWTAALVKLERLIGKN